MRHFLWSYHHHISMPRRGSWLSGFYGTSCFTLTVKSSLGYGLPQAHVENRSELTGNNNQVWDYPNPKEENQRGKGLGSRNAIIFQRGK